MALPAVSLLICLTLAQAADRRRPPTPSYQTLMQDVLINSDLWTDEPEILSANYAFDNITGVPFGTQAAVRAAGGTWEKLDCADPAQRALTSSSTPSGVAFSFGYPVRYADALPVVFSWPVLPSTVQPEDFRLVLNTGRVVKPEVVSISPNQEYNERHVVVVFGKFGNRIPPGKFGSVWVKEVRVVDDGTPLQLVGPVGPVSAVGLVKENAAQDTPYLTGPSLVAAKLSVMSVEGEGAPALFAGQLPNDGVTLYGAEAQYRLRVYTSGGFSPDGVRSVLPTEFARYFRLHVETNSGEILVTETGVDYDIDGATLRVVGLADLGLKQDTYDGCYVEDHDNYIDIVLAGDEVAMRKVTQVEIPAGEGYSPFYNPGGPGNNPTRGVRYTAPGPSDLQPVTIAIDDPKTVSYPP